MSVNEAESLGQSVNGHPENVDGALPRLVELLQSADVEVVEAAIYALGHAWDARAARAILPFACHSSPGVRDAVATTLPSGVTSTDDVYDPVVAALVVLTNDVDDDVRDWACFGLGQLEADGEDVRDALAARLDDAHTETRCEALVALAKTGDPRALARTLERLTDARHVWGLELEAAAELADPALLPALARLGPRWEGDDLTEDVERALRRCAADAAAGAAEMELAFLTGIVERLRDAAITVSVSGAYPRTLVSIVAGDRVYEARLWDATDPFTEDFEQRIASWELTARNLLH